MIQAGEHRDGGLGLRRPSPSAHSRRGSRRGRRTADGDGFSARKSFEPFVKGLDVLDQGPALLLRNRLPGRHGGSGDAVRDSPEEVVVGWQRSGRRGPNLEFACRQIARLRVKKRSGRAVALPLDPVTDATFFLIKALA